MTDTSGPPPPPPSTPPPPPLVPETGEPASSRTSNGIAVAGIVTALLALILSIIVIGGFLGFVSFGLSAIGLRRARRGQGGKGTAIGGLVLSVLAIAVSGAAFAIILATIRGEDRVIDDIVSSSTNETYPPQRDLVSIDCGTSTNGRIGLATVELVNRSPSPSIYEVTVEWTSDTGPVTAVTNSEFVAQDETVRLELLELTGAGDPADCRVSRIERSGIPFLN